MIEYRDRDVFGDKKIMRYRFPWREILVSLSGTLIGFMIYLDKYGW